MSLAKLTKRERIIFYLCISLVSIAILNKIVFLPLANRVVKLSDEIKLKESRLTKGLLRDKSREDIVKDYKASERYLKLKGSDEEIMSEFLREIERLASESGVSLSDVKPSSTNNFSSYKEFIVEVKTDAALKDIVRFLYNLNESDLLLRVERLVLNLKEENSDILKVVMQINGVMAL